jgi:hypothetical protein
MQPLVRDEEGQLRPKAATEGMSLFEDEGLEAAIVSSALVTVGEAISPKALVATY